MVKLRLKRIGRRNLAVYRLAAMDSRRPRDGRVLEELGQYAPNSEAGKQLVVNADRIKHWLSLGAQPTDTVRTLLKQQGIASN